MENDRIQSYFEAGKLAGLASRNYLVLCFILTFFNISPYSGKLKVPVINVELEHSMFIVVLLYLTTFQLYRTLAAVGYERVLRDRLQCEMENCRETVWRVSYPNTFNFLQFSEIFGDRKYYFMNTAVAVSIMCFTCFVLPIMSVISSFDASWSWQKYIAVISWLIVHVGTLFLMMRNFNKLSNQEKSDSRQDSPKST